MARQFYKEHLQIIPACQNKGDNLADLEEFAPGLITVVGGIIHLEGPAGPQPIPLDDWLMDDPSIGFVTIITNKAFASRFEAGGPNLQPS